MFRSGTPLAVNSPAPANRGVERPKSCVKAKLINANPKTYAIIFETGDEVTEGLRQFARQQRLSASQFTAIGAFSDVVLGFFSLERRDYNRIVFMEQVEVLSLIGDVSLKGDEPEVHAHVVVGTADGSAHGGHLLEAHVRPTLEVILTETPAHLCRTFNPKVGLALINVEKDG